MLVAGCGGGTGSPTVPVANRPPVFVSPNSVSIVENTATAFYRVAATDADNDAVTYTIVGGADATLFSLSGDQLAFVGTPPNFERPRDADGNNVYDVQIGASDGRSSATLSLIVTVTNSKEGVSVRRIATGFVDPVALAPVSNTVVLVAEKRGAIYSLNPTTGARALLYQIPNIGAVGVVAIGADPAYATSGIFFVMYTTSGGMLTLYRFLPNAVGPVVPDNTGPVFSVSAPNYAGGGWLFFDDSKTFFAATGDAGGVGDPSGSAQNGSSLLGKIIQVKADPDPYGGAAINWWIRTVVASGLHQPNGVTNIASMPVFADRGETTADEIDLYPREITNFGWPFKEGKQVVLGAPPTGVVDPVVDFLRGTGLISGGGIVGGASAPNAIASLNGQYIFGSRGGAIFVTPARAFLPGQSALLNIERRDADFAPDAGTIDSPVAFASATNSGLYILDSDGELFTVE